MYAQSTPGYLIVACGETRICKLPPESSWLVCVRATVPFCALGLLGELEVWDGGGGGRGGNGEWVGEERSWVRGGTGLAAIVGLMMDLIPNPYLDI